jgi:hypothetical protein
VKAVNPVEDCLDGTRVVEVELDAPLDESMMHGLAAGGELAYYPSFSRPYFRIQHRGVCVIQGVIGKTTFRATWSRSVVAEIESIVTSLLQRRNG